MARPRKSADQAVTISVSLRVDPKIKFLIDLMSRSKRQSITGVIEAAVIETAQDMPGYVVCDGEKHSVGLAHAAFEIWSTDESERFISLCFNMPELLTYEEQRIWETIKATKYFWGNDLEPFDDDRWKNSNQEYLSIYLIRKHWDEILDHVDKNKDSRTVIPMFFME